MNRKIILLCLLLTLLLLIGVVNAEDSNDSQPVKSLDVNSSEVGLSNDFGCEIKLESNKAVSQASSNKHKVSLKAGDVKMYYGDGTKFKVTLKDNKNKAIKNAKVKIDVNGKSYTKTTDTKGVAFLNLNFESGTYKLTTTYEGSKNFLKKSIKNTVTIKSTIKANDFSKFHKNTEKFTATFLDDNGKSLKKVKIKYAFPNTKIKEAKTDRNGNVKIKVSLTPGKYKIALANTKTGEVSYRIITIKNTLQQLGLSVDKLGNAKYSVKLLNDKGKINPNQKVSFKFNNKAYNIKSDKNGVATLYVKINAGSHKILTQYNGEKILYEFSIKNNAPQVQNISDNVGSSNFTHITLLPDYVNLTNEYVLSDSRYAVKTGAEGILKLPKNEMITVQMENKTYYFSNSYQVGDNVNIIATFYYLVPFDASPLQCAFSENKLKGDGIVIYNKNDNIVFKYRSKTESSADLFGVVMCKNALDSEAIMYVQNNKIKAVISFFTQSYDEYGLKSNLARFYNKLFQQFDYMNYEELIGDKVKLIRYTNTNESIEFSSFGNYIVGNPSKEHIITKFSVNGNEEMEKHEIISYGLSEKYVPSAGFEVLQSYAIASSKITPDIVESWLSKNKTYLSINRISSIYSMFMAALETILIADELANQNAKEFNVSWQRNGTSTVLAGINLDHVYMHILNADMGMSVTGKNEDVVFFKLINSLCLPDIETACFRDISNKTGENSINSLNNLLNSFENNNFSIAQIGDVFYIFGSGDSNATMLLNSTTGVAEVLLIEDNFAYKGAMFSPACTPCRLVELSEMVLGHVSNFLNMVKSAVSNVYNFVTNKVTPLLVFGYQAASYTSGVAGGLAQGGVGLGVTSFLSIVGSAIGAQSAAIHVREHFVDKKDWHWAYDWVPLSRNGPLQYKKTFNIPKSDGTTDYIEVKINDDGSLNRDEAYYISPNSIKKLSKKETYKYFSEETWLSGNVPKKYQKFPI